MIESSVFGSVYADNYDLFYQNKNYEAECDFLEAIFQRFSDIPVRSILDLGCGTGGHAVSLLKRGYHLTGVDRSDEMLKTARRKTQSLKLKPGICKFLLGDVRTIRLNKVFDSAIMMFAVLGYQTLNENLAAALATVRKHLKPNSIFIADFWYGPAVLAQRPNDRVREWFDNGSRIIRLAHPQLSVDQHIVKVHYHILHLKGAQLVAETEEEHKMRFIFPQELAYFASQAGLRLEHICPLLKLDENVIEDTWNVAVVLRAV